MRLVRAVRVAGLSVLATAAVIVWFTLKPEPIGEPVGLAEVEDFLSIGSDLADAANQLIDLALENYDTNNERADSAPKQQVVNGWVARELLTAIAMTNATQIQMSIDQITIELLDLKAARRVDERPQALLLLLVLAVAFSGVTAAAERP